MTYCCGILVRDGLVMMADTRTNAGLDNISTFRKLHVFGVPGQRIIGACSSGNLSISQSVVSTVTEGDRNRRQGSETLFNAPQFPGGAGMAGDPAGHKLEGDALEAPTSKFECLVPVRRSDQRRQDAPVHDLRRRQFPSMLVDSPYLADRGAQIRQAGARSRHHYGVDLYDALRSA